LAYAVSQIAALKDPTSPTGSRPSSARSLPPFHANVGKRLVKSPKTYVRDSGLTHALLNIESFEDLLGHPVSGPSREGFVIENLITAAPSRAQASFYRTATGAEIDLLLELGGRWGTWAVEIKRS
jgi:predicted AAA+ superfamily ATPase